jgi:hypothetical protein
MVNFLRTMIYVIQRSARFIGLAILTFLAVAISFTINAIAMTHPFLWLLASKFQVLNSSISHLAALSRFFRLGGA